MLCASSACYVCRPRAMRAIHMCERLDTPASQKCALKISRNLQQGPCQSPTSKSCWFPRIRSCGITDVTANGIDPSRTPYPIRNKGTTKHAHSRGNRYNCRSGAQSTESTNASRRTVGKANRENKPSDTSKQHQPAGRTSKTAWQQNQPAESINGPIGRIDQQRKAARPTTASARKEAS